MTQLWLCTFRELAAKQRKRRLAEVGSALSAVSAEQSFEIKQSETRVALPLQRWVGSAALLSLMMCACSSKML